MIRCLWTYIQVLLYRKKEGDYWVARTSLISHSTFDLPASAQRDMFIGFRECKRLLGMLRVSRETMDLADSKALIFDGKVANEPLRVNYLNRLLTYESYAFVAKAQLPHLASLSTRIRGMCLLLALGLPLALFAMLHPRRHNLALVMRNAYLSLCLRQVLRSKHVECVYDFIPFANEANTNFLVNSKYVGHWVKIPSVGPLSSHNSHMLSDQVWVTSPYHKDEIQAFGASFKASQIVTSYPEDFDEYFDIYTKREQRSDISNIGFYSHASWIRKLEDHGESLFSDANSEETALKNLLAAVSEIDNNVQVVIFTHPRERKPEMKEKTEAYYKKLSQKHGVSIELNFSGNKSTHQFDKVDIGIGAMSTILFERLFMGYKTLFWTADQLSFPVDGSSLSRICVTSMEQLQSELSEALVQTSNDFFLTRDMDSYPFYSTFYEMKAQHDQP